MNCTLSLRCVVLLATFILPFQAKAQNSNNNPSGAFSAILAGSNNRIQTNVSFGLISGGQGNTIFSNSPHDTISGGMSNTAFGAKSTVAGGVSNSANSPFATVSGGENNVANGDYATIGGGLVNDTGGRGATVGGGEQNLANVIYATVGGGYSNSASTNSATVGGGFMNTAGGSDSTVGGGFQNAAGGKQSSVAGGNFNSASGTLSVIGGGIKNQAAGICATIPGGSNNLARTNSFAAGVRSKALHDGAFVWSGVTNTDTSSTNTNSFTVRAPGGARFITQANATISGTTNGVILSPGGNSWASLSDSNAKTAIRPIKPREILAKLASMPVTEWQYKGQPERSYIGPMAQDFHASFGLGSDDKTIATADSDGVMYAAIQGLVEELKRRDQAMALRDRAIEELKSELRNLREEVHNSLPATP